MVHDDGPLGLGGVQVAFDDQRVVSDAGIVLAATLAQRLGIESLIEQAVDLGERPGAANPGAKVMTLVSAMALGADCIDDCVRAQAGPERAGSVEPGRNVVCRPHPGARTHTHLQQLSTLTSSAARRSTS